MAIGRRAGSGQEEARALLTLGRALARLGRDGAEEACRRAIELNHAGRQWFPTWIAIDIVVFRWASTGDNHRAAIVLGHLDAHHVAPGPPQFARMRVDARERLLGDNGKAERADAMHVGAAMSRDELVAFVLHELGSRDPVAAIQTAAPSKKR